MWLPKGPPWEHVAAAPTTTPPIPWAAGLWERLWLGQPAAAAAHHHDPQPNRCRWPPLFTSPPTPGSLVPRPPAGVWAPLPAGQAAPRLAAAPHPPLCGGGMPPVCLPLYTHGGGSPSHGDGPLRGGRAGGGGVGGGGAGGGAAPPRLWAGARGDVRNGVRCGGRVARRRRRASAPWGLGRWACGWVCRPPACGQRPTLAAGCQPCHHAGRQPPRGRPAGSRGCAPPPPPPPQTPPPTPPLLWPIFPPPSLWQGRQAGMGKGKTESALCSPPHPIRPCSSLPPQQRRSWHTAVGSATRGTERGTGRGG